MSFKFIVRIATLTVAIVLSAFSIAAVEDDIAKRIAPTGSLCMSGDDCAAAPVAVASGPRSGEDVYNTCAACHNTGAAGAPKLGDAAAWAPRIAKGNDTLYDHAINGFNGMPAKGLCGDCSDDEIKAAVDHIIANSQ